MQSSRVTTLTSGHQNNLESIYGLYLTEISINSENVGEARPTFPRPTLWFGSEQPLSLLVIKAPSKDCRLPLPTLLMKGKKHSRHFRKLTLTNLRFSYDTHSKAWSSSLSVVLKKKITRFSLNLILDLEDERCPNLLRKQKAFTI